MYKQKTRKYCLPVLGYGDTIVPEIELRKWQFVENILLACLQGNETAIFGEGDLVFEKDVSDNLFLVMYPGKTGIVCRGISDGMYFDAKRKLKWGPLKPGRFYYASVHAYEKTFHDPADFSTVFSEIKPATEKAALIATVDLRHKIYEIDRYPPGKNNVASLFLHINDNDNPHGEFLVQKQMHITSRLDASEIQSDVINTKSLILNGTEICFAAERLTPEIKEVRLYPGENEIKSSINGRIMFAQLLNPDNELHLTLGNGNLIISNRGAEKTVVLNLTISSNHD